MVLQYFKRKDNEPAETKASATAKLRPWHFTGSTITGARDVGTLTRTGFLGNAVGFRAVKMVCEAGASIPLNVIENGAVMDIHPIKSLLARPNDNQSGAEFMESLIGQLVLSGNAFVEGVCAEQDASLAELYILRTDRMRVLPGADGWPKGYEYRVGGKAVVFPSVPECPAICHIKNFHPCDDHYGLAPIHAAAQAIDVHNAASIWAKALLENAARPSGAIVYAGQEGQGTLSAEQYDRLLSEIESHHQGARNAGRPMLLEGGLDWKPMGYSPNDMEFQKTKDAAAREIALTFGVPPMLLGMPGDATYANYQEAHRAFYRLTVLPLIQKVAGALSWFLSQHMQEGVSLQPDLDFVTALAPEREAQWARIANADFLSNAEKRSLLGLGASQESDFGGDDG